MKPKESLELFINPQNEVHEHITKKHVLALEMCSKELGSDLVMKVKKTAGECPLCSARISAFRSRRTGLGFAALIA